jgi:hypothetical protein
MAMEGRDGRFLSASTFAAKIASAGNLNGSKNRSGYAGSKILDALIPAAPEALPVSSTQHIYLSLNNPSLHFSKHGLAFLQIQGLSLRARLRMQAAPHWIPAPVPGCGRRGAFRPKLENPSEPPAPTSSSGKHLSESTTHSVLPPALIQSHGFSLCPSQDVPRRFNHFIGDELKVVNLGRPGAASTLRSALARQALRQIALKHCAK